MSQDFSIHVLASSIVVNTLARIPLLTPTLSAMFTVVKSLPGVVLTYAKRSKASVTGETMRLTMSNTEVFKVDREFHGFLGMTDSGPGP